MYFSLQIAKLGYFPKIPNPAQKEQDSGYIVCATATRLSSEGKQTKLRRTIAERNPKMVWSWVRLFFWFLQILMISSSGFWFKLLPNFIQFSIAAINDTDSTGQWEPLAPTKEAQARPVLSLFLVHVFWCLFVSISPRHGLCLEKLCLFINFLCKCSGLLAFRVSETNVIEL